MSNDRDWMLDAFEGMYGDADDVRCYSRRTVQTRADHQCPGYFKGALHTFPAGSLAVIERGLVDGKWSTCYTCEECIRAWRKKYNDEAA